MSGCNKLWSVCAVDPTGPVSKDAGEQSPGSGIGPAVGESSRPPCGRKAGESNEQNGMWDVGHDWVSQRGFCHIDELGLITWPCATSGRK
jgi:hypothetical protein